MKKTTTHLLMALHLLIIISIAYSGCAKKSDPECPTGDKAKLEFFIDEAKLLHDAAIEGNESGEYLAGSKGVLMEEITRARAVAENDCSSQVAIDKAFEALDYQMDLFKLKVNP